MTKTIKLKDIEHYSLGGENKIKDWIEEDGTNSRVEEVVLKKWKEHVSFSPIGWLTYYVDWLN